MHLPIAKNTKKNIQKRMCNVFVYNLHKIYRRMLYTYIGFTCIELHHLS